MDYVYVIRRIEGQGSYSVVERGRRGDECRVVSAQRDGDTAVRRAEVRSSREGAERRRMERT